MAKHYNWSLKVSAHLDQTTNSIDTCLISLILFFFFYRALDWFLIWLGRDDVEYDLELGVVPHHSAADSNLWVIEIVNRFVQATGDRQRQQQLQDLSNMPRLVNYRRQETTSTYCTSECAICLDDFADDQACRVFPVCNHIFHLHCIDKWLDDHETCPLCRSCILDV